jgi:hypothetical protein
MDSFLQLLFSIFFVLKYKVYYFFFYLFFFNLSFIIWFHLIFILNLVIILFFWLLFFFSLSYWVLFLILSISIWFQIIILNLILILFIIISFVSGLFYYIFFFQFHPSAFCWCRILLHYFLGISFYRVKLGLMTKVVSKVNMGWLWIFLGSFKKKINFIFQHLIYWESVFMLFFHFLFYEVISSALMVMILAG